MEHRDRLHESFEQAADWQRDQLVQFGKTGIDHHMLHDSCKRNRNEGGAGPLSDGN